MNHWDEIGNRTNGYIDGLLSDLQQSADSALAGARAELAAAIRERDTESANNAVLLNKIGLLEDRIRELETTVTPPATPTEGLAWAMPNMSASDKRYFPHYFGPYPISFDNKPASQDTYATNFNNPQGQYKSTGGWFRDRPMPRSPLTGDFKRQDLATEVKQARAAGIDGFWVDMLGLSGSNFDAYRSLANVASELYPDGSFKVLPMVDRNGATGQGTPTQAADSIAYFATKKSAHYLPDGRFVVGSFKAEGNPLAWWQQTFAELKTRYNLTVAFVGVFLDGSKAPDYAPILWMSSVWGYGADPNVIAKATDYAGPARSRGQKWMAPVVPQDIRPLDRWYDEALGTGSLRAGWDRAIRENADWVQYITWNDHSETPGGVTAANGYTLLDVATYDLIKWKTGSYPKILRVAVYLAHRAHLVGAPLSSGQTSRMSQKARSNTTSAADVVEVLTFLTAPASVTVNVGISTITYDAPAGRFAKQVPLKVGAVAVGWKRDGQLLGTMISPIKVVATPVIDDLGYYRFSSLRGTAGQYKP